MPFKMEVTNKLVTRSARIKNVDLHPKESWILCALYDGTIQIWDYETHMQIRTLKVCNFPIRSAKFITRKKWVVTGSDDMKIRIYNYNTFENVYSFEAHADFIRSIIIHPTLPYMITSSDDMLIKQWNWDRNWVCQQIYKDHTHSVMQVAMNPKNNDTFASASLDNTIKVWQMESSIPNFTLKGHNSGVNCVSYHGGDMPYLVSGDDDFLIKIWDYQNKICIRTLNGHFGNLTAVLFHPRLPYVLSGSEDCTVNIWHERTYKPETLINQKKGRVWTMCTVRDSNNIAVGYDEGVIMVQIGSEEPTIAFDVAGKITWAKHYNLQQIHVKTLPDAVKDEEVIHFVPKDLGSCEFYPETIAYNSNGRFLAVCGEGEYIIYTAMALRNKAFGLAQEFVWGKNSDYAILEHSTVKVFRSFKESIKCFNLDSNVKRIFGGHLLGLMEDTNIISFYDWENSEMLSRMEIACQVRRVYWSENGELLCLVTDEKYYVLKYNASVANPTDAAKTDCVENAFEEIRVINEIVLSGVWVGECFVYTNSEMKLKYDILGNIINVKNLDCVMYVLGYIAKEHRLYLTDKNLNITSFTLLQSVLEYQTADMNKCSKSTLELLLSRIPLDHRNEVDHFTVKYTELERNFQCALSVGDLKESRALAESITTLNGISSSKISTTWTRLGDSALAANDIELTKTCYLKARNLSSLLLLSSSIGEKELLREVAGVAVSEGQYNIAFTAYFILNDMGSCYNLLIKQKHLAEAAIFARSYIPSKVIEAVEQWRFGVDKRLGQYLADPLRYENLFPEYKDSLTLDNIQKFGCSDEVDDIQLNLDRDLSGNVEDPNKCQIEDRVDFQ